MLKNTLRCSKNREKRWQFRTCGLIFEVAGALPKGKIILLAALMRASSALRRISALDSASLCSQYEFESIRARKRVWRGLCLRQNNFALGLQASLTHSPAKLAHSHSAAWNLSSLDTTNKNMGRAMLSPYFWSPTCNFIRTRNVSKEHSF